jgi:DNA-binding transcriptional ArsR family regulator
MDNHKMDAEFEQKSQITINDLETLKVISDPLRRRILELALVEPMTTKQIAEALEAAPSKVYYHVRLLENHGLLKVAETRLIANMVENLYQTAAQQISVDPSLLLSPASEGSGAFDQLIGDFFDDAKAQVRGSIQARLIDLEMVEGKRPRLANAHFSHSLFRLSPGKAAELRQRLRGLLEELDALEDPDDPEGQYYRLVLGLYPSLLAPGELDGDE